MRTKIYATLICMLALAFSACTNEEDNLFNESAAQRLNESVSKYQTLLESSDSGWVMEFLPSDGSYGGFIYTARFKDGNVDMASEIGLQNSSTGETWPAGTIVSSKYEVKSEQGVILTFDTYNLLFHFFSEPRGSSDTDGYESDYEFIFMRTSADNDTIYLSGKKYHNELKMYKLSSDMQSYISKVLETETNVTQVNRTSMEIDGKSYPITFDGRYLTVIDIDSDSVALETPLMFNDNGFRLYTPITLNGITYEYFVYDSATGNVTSTDGSAVITLPSAYDQFFHSRYPWYFQATVDGDYEMSDALYTDLRRAMTYSSSYTFSSVGITDPTRTSDINKGFPKVLYFQWVMHFGSWTFYLGGTYGISITITDEANSIYAITGLGDGYSFSGTRRTACMPFVNDIVNNSPYKVEFNDGLVKTTARFTSTTDSTVWFTLKLNSIME